MRSFDQRYAKETVPGGNEDPGHFLVRRAERLLPAGTAVPAGVGRAAIISTHLAYGTTYGVLYALLMLAVPAERANHPFVFGSLLGVVVWAVGHLGLLAGLDLGPAAWKQDRAELAGEVTRHVAYGIATAAAYGTIHHAR